MTKEMLNMSKEELINAIASMDKHGKELERLTKEMIEARDELQSQVDKMTEDIDQGIHTMTLSAIAVADMRKLLRDKYGSFVM